MHFCQIKRMSESSNGRKQKNKKEIRFSETEWGVGRRVVESSSDHSQVTMGDNGAARRLMVRSAYISPTHI